MKESRGTTHSRRGVLTMVGSATGAGLAAALMYPAPATVEAATVHHGVRKGIHWTRTWWGRDPHHYVEFDLNYCRRNNTYRVEGPGNPTLWVLPGPCDATVRAYYSAAGFWDDGRPASAWRLHVG